MSSTRPFIKEVDIKKYLRDLEWPTVWENDKDHSLPKDPPFIILQKMKVDILPSFARTPRMINLILVYDSYGATDQVKAFGLDEKLLADLYYNACYIAVQSGEMHDRNDVPGLKNRRVDIAQFLLEAV